MEYLHFALGKLYDDCGLYDDAFECYRRANQICNNKVHYVPDRISDVTRSLIDTFTRDFLAQPFAFASHSQQPLFIVGMPRSGTTLLANILSNHPAIATAGELSTMAGSTLQLQKLLELSIPYPQAVRHLTPAIALRLIADYEKRLRRDTSPDTPHIIDKHPMNFWNLGLISMLFPKGANYPLHPPSLRYVPVQFFSVFRAGLRLCIRSAQHGALLQRIYKHDGPLAENSSWTDN